MEAAAVARAAGRVDLVAEAALVLDAVGEPVADQAVRRLCEEALRGVDLAATALRARLLARFSDACMYLEDVDAAAPASELGLALAERSGDAIARVAALRARQLVRSGPSGLVEREALADRMLAIGRATGDAGTEMWAHLWKVDAAFERGDLGTVMHELARLTRLAEEVRGPVARFQVLRTQAALAQALGRFDEARRTLDEAFATLAPTGHASAIHVRAGMMAMLGHHLGQDADSLAAFGLTDAPVDELRVPTVGVISAIAAAFVLAGAGRHADAATVYRALGPVAGWRPMPHVLLVSYAFGVAVAMSVGSRDDVGTLRDLLSPYRGHHAVSGAGPVSYLGPVELWLGKAAAHLDLLDDAVVDLEQAVKAAAGAGAPAFRAEAQSELAAALAGRGRPGDDRRAESLASESAREAERLGLASVVLRAGPLVAAIPSALTRREREVAALVAEGMTNREIAARLFLSERTAQNHVQHILTKLDLSNRSQIVAHMARQK
jgi:DNA-binding CsgD family transcriptional regulator